MELNDRCASFLWISCTSGWNIPFIYNEVEWKHRSEKINCNGIAKHHLHFMWSGVLGNINEWARTTSDMFVFHLLSSGALLKCLIHKRQYLSPGSKHTLTFSTSSKLKIAPSSYSSHGEMKHLACIECIFQLPVFWCLYILCIFYYVYTVYWCCWLYWIHVG